MLYEVITGKKGAVKITASVDLGMQEVAKTLDLATTDQWTKIITEAATAAGNSVPDIALNPQEPGKGVDWQDEVYRNALVQNYSVGASGGSDNLKYNFSLGYLDQDGIVDKTDYSRLNMRLKSEFQKGRVKVGESIV